MQDSETIQSTKCAKVLFSLSLITLLAVWLLNRTIAESQREHAVHAQRYERMSNMLGKLRAFRFKNEGLFTSLALIVAEDNPPFFEGVASQHDVASGRIKWFHNDMFMFQAVQFGSDATAIFGVNGDRERRLTLLTDAVEAAFKTNTVRHRFDNEVMTHMNQLADDQEWPAIVDWIVDSKWPPRDRGTTISVSGRNGVSYVNRFPANWGPWEDASRERERLIACSSSSEAESLLESYRTKAYETLRNEKPAEGNINVSGTGLSFTPGDFLMLAGPILVFFQLLYLIFKNKESNFDRPSSADKQLFSFPQFSCPDDPLGSRIARDLASLGERAIWLLFLTLPPAIVSVAIATRYDLVSIVSVPASLKLPRMQAQLLLQTTDVSSDVFDTINIICLGTSLAILIALTSPKTGEQGRRYWGRKGKWLFFSSCAVLVTAVWFAFTFRWSRSFMFLVVSYKGLAMALFGLMLMCCFGIGLWRQSKIGTLVPAVGLVILIYLLF